MMLLRRSLPTFRGVQTTDHEPPILPSAGQRSIHVRRQLCAAADEPARPQPTAELARTDSVRVTTDRGSLAPDEAERLGCPALVDPARPTADDQDVEGRRRADVVIRHDAQPVASGRCGRKSSCARRHAKAFRGAWWGAPKTRALYEATYFAGLRKAGMPEE